MKLFGLILLICLTINTAMSANTLPSSTNLTENVEQLSAAQFLEDPEKQLTFPYITTLKPQHWQPFKPQTSFKSGYSHSNWWLRFNLNIPSSETWYLVSDYPIGGELELYISTDNQTVDSKLFTPLKNHRTPTWQLNLAPNQTVTAYLRANNGQALLYVPLRLISSHEFISHSNQQYMFFMLIFAGLWVLAFYNLFLLFSLRELNYLTLVMAIIMIQIMFYRDSNLFPELSFINDTHTWYYPLPFLVSMVLALAYWRTINQQGGKVLEKLLKWSQWSSPIIFLALLVSGSNQFFYIIISILAPLVLLLVTHTAMNGHRQTRSAYSAAFAFAISINSYALTHTGWLTQFIEEGIYIGHAGILIAFLLLSINQADRSRLLREQAESERAANQAKSEFLTTMSHELRTPLHAVIGISDLLQQTPLSTLQKDYVNKLRVSSKHVLKLIDNVLNLSHMDNVQTQLEITPFELPKLLTELEQMFMTTAREKGLTLSIHQVACSTNQYLGDVERLKMILVNLLGNAIKYTHNGKVSLVVTCFNSNVLFEVIDTGVGITPEQQVHLFEAFYQVSGGKNRKYGGIGLGLNISYKLVQYMGGTLALESKPDNGSRFFFSLELPLYKETIRPSIENKTPSKTHKDSLQGIHILLVDDDDVNRFIGKKLLSSRGATVSLAETGSQALQQVQQQTFDVVLMDISMPDMNGYEATKQIHSIPICKNLPIIALTAHAITGEKERCLTAGMSDFLTKPFILDELVTTITKLIPICEKIK